LKFCHVLCNVGNILVLEAVLDLGTHCVTNLRVGPLALGHAPDRNVAISERIALAIADINNCNYCLAAHSYLAKNLAKLDDAEIAANRNGSSNDRKADAAVRFAVKVATERGHVSDADLEAVRAAGFGDAEVVEIVLHVALNTLTIDEALACQERKCFVSSGEGVSYPCIFFSRI
jgi:AhpD family alkylhydroperoxidase